MQLDKKILEVLPNPSRSLLLFLLLLRRAPRALEGGPSERQPFLGVGREDSERGGDDGLPKMCCRRTSRFVHLCSHFQGL